MEFKDCKKILYLVVSKVWFDKLASGDKKFEFRLAKPYWDSRLYRRWYSHARFVCGYKKNADRILVELKSIKLKHVIYPITNTKELCYVIELGKRKELKC